MVVRFQRKSRIHHISLPFLYIYVYPISLSLPISPLKPPNYLTKTKSVDTNVKEAPLDSPDSAPIFLSATLRHFIARKNATTQGRIYLPGTPYLETTAGVSFDAISPNCENISLRLEHIERFRVLRSNFRPCLLWQIQRDHHSDNQWTTLLTQGFL